MKNLTVALFLILAGTGPVPAQLPPAYVSEVNPLENQDFAAAFGDLTLQGTTLHLRPASKDSNFKVQVGNSAVIPFSSRGVNLPLGTETHIFDTKMYVKFLPFPSSETDKYLFLVEASNAQGLTRVGLISVHNLVGTQDHQSVPTTAEQPILIDCARCLKEMEARVANGTYEYEG